MAWGTPPTPGAGSVVTAAQFATIANDLNFLRSGVLAFTEVTATSASTSATTELVVASQAFTADGTTAVEVSYSFHALLKTVGTDTFQVLLYDGPTAGSGTMLANLNTGNASATTTSGGFVRKILTPSAGSHTFTARIVRVGGTGTAQAYGAATAPACIAVVQAN